MRRVIAAAVVAFAPLVGLLATPARAADGPPRIVFATPQDGTTVAGPVEVAVTVTNFELIPAGSVTQKGKGHAHVLIDEEPPAPRTFLPTNDPNIVHMGTAPLESRSIDMTPGEHTLYAVLGDSDHLVVENQQPAKITITVAPGLRAKGPLPNACADVAKGQGDVRVVFPLVDGAIQGTVASSCGFVTDGGKCQWQDLAFRRITGTFSLEDRALAGTATGITSRQLRAGSRKSCGGDTSSALSPQIFAATVNEQGLQGTLGRSPIVLQLDPQTRLAQAPPPPATTGGGGGRSWQDYWPFAAAVVLLLGAGYYAATNRPPQTD